MFHRVDNVLQGTHKNDIKTNMVWICYLKCHINMYNEWTCTRRRKNEKYLRTHWSRTEIVRHVRRSVIWLTTLFFLFMYVYIFCIHTIKNNLWTICPAYFSLTTTRPHYYVFLFLTARATLSIRVSCAFPVPVLVPFNLPINLIKRLRRIGDAMRWKPTIESSRYFNWTLI